MAKDKSKKKVRVEGDEVEAAEPVNKNKRHRKDKRELLPSLA